jgi:hypothetical protein
MYFLYFVSYVLCVIYVKNIDSKRNIVNNKFMILSAWENINVVEDSVPTCLLNFAAIVWTVPEKRVHESDRFTIADIEGTTSPKNESKYLEFSAHI